MEEEWIQQYKKELRNPTKYNIEMLLSYPITHGVVPETPEGRIRYRMIEEEAKRRGIELEQGV